MSEQPGNTRDRLREDLDFVRSAVRRGEDDRGFALLYFLWAAVIAVGFALPDFAPTHALPFWIVAALAGGLFSWWYGARRQTADGVRDARTGRRHGWHWMLSGVAIGLVMVMGLSGALDPRQMATLLLLTVGLSYALAGVHLHPPMLPAGLIMLASAGAMLWLRLPYVWTSTGLAVGAALVAAGIGASRRR